MKERSTARALHRWLERWVAMIQRYPRATLSVALGLAVASLMVTLLHLGFKTNRDDLVDPSQQYYQNWKKYADEFDEQLDIIVAVAGKDRAQMIQAIETIARDMKAYPHHFAKLCYRLDLSKIKAKGLYQLKVDELQLIRGQLEQLRPLLVGTWHFLTLDNVMRATTFRLNQHPSDQPLTEEDRSAVADTTRLIDSYNTYLTTGTIYRSPWRTLITRPSQSEWGSEGEYLFSPTGDVAFVRVLPVNDPNSFTGVHEPVRITRSIIARTQQAFPDLKFGLTGLPVLEYDEMRSAQHDSMVSMSMSVVGVALLFFVAFRAMRHPLYAIVALLIGGCWTMGWLTLTVGHLNILSVSFIVTLVGLGIDYGILWLTSYESAICHGHSRSHSNLRAASIVGPGILVGAVTTALAFYASMFTGFLGLRELGWIAGSGVLLCVLSSFTVLPALLVLMGRPTGKMAGAQDLTCEEPFCPTLQSRPMLLLLGIAVGVAVLATQIPKLRFDFNLLNLQASGLPSVDWEHRLVEEWGTSVWYALSVADTPEEARERAKKFAALPSVGRVVELASLLPADSDVKQPIIEKIHMELLRLPTRGTIPTLPTPQAERMQRFLADLHSVKLPSNFADRALVTELQLSVLRLEQSLSQVSAREQSRMADEYQYRWIRDLLDQLHELKEAANPQPVTVDDLPPALRERYVGPHGKWLIEIYANASVWDMQPLRGYVNEVQSVDPNATGKPISTLHALEEMNAGYLQSAWLAFLVIVVAVWFDFRRLDLALLSLAPLMMGFVSLFGVMGLFDIPFNPANLIALPMVLGIGIDYGVHILHDFRTHRHGQYFLSQRLVKALLLSSGTTVLSFATMMISRHQGMKSIGIVLAVGVTACAVGALVLLPSILRWATRRRPAVENLLLPGIQSQGDSSAPTRVA